MVAPYEVPKGSVIVGGKAWPCAAEVRGWKQTGLEVMVGKGARPRGKNKVRLSVWHWTASEEKDAKRVYEVLVEQGLGIEFVIDADGVISQFCDPALVDSYDAGNWNRWSVGTEIISAGIAPAKTKRPRGVHTETIHGRKEQVLDFYPAQLTAAFALADTLHEALNIPKVVATSSTAMSTAELDAFAGAVGHLNLTTEKRDPGTLFLKKLAEHWGQV